MDELPDVSQRIRQLGIHKCNPQGKVHSRYRPARPYRDMPHSIRLPNWRTKKMQTEDEKQPGCYLALSWSSLQGSGARYRARLPRKNGRNTRYTVVVQWHPPLLSCLDQEEQPLDRWPQYGRILHYPKPPTERLLGFRAASQAHLPGGTTRESIAARGQPAGHLRRPRAGKPNAPSPQPPDALLHRRRQREPSRLGKTCD
ncbi:hypothetical protein CCANI_12860 [Corynebacterium canis]|nr:hypothetical protein CCANI_12860 [Corynebacterium canis]